MQAAGRDPDTWASNTDSIVNTRHNLTMSYMTHEITGADFSWLMDTSRINYGEVCVYCHTPHGSNTSTLQAPLWNRAMGTTVYNLYSIPLSSGQSATAPGSSSLACLSCHDGTLAIDAIINLPGSGYYAGEDTVPSDAFLDAWPTGTVSSHKKLKPEVGLPPDSCRLCHKAGSVAEDLPFDAFALETDLRDDHPIGVKYPSYIDADYDYNPPDVEVANRFAYFESTANGHADKNEMRHMPRPARRSLGRPWQRVHPQLPAGQQCRQRIVHDLPYQVRPCHIRACRHYSATGLFSVT